MSNSIQHLWQKFTNIKPSETKLVVLSFGFAFLLMCSYAMLKPIRDAMTSDWSNTEVSQLWTFTFLFSFVATFIHGFFASKISLKRLVPGIYAFFAITFIVFYLIYQFVPEEGSNVTGPDNLLSKKSIGQGYYVWVSVFALFHLSVFWSFMSQIYTREQALRLFAFIGTGVGAGAIAGPLLTIALSNTVGIANLILIASAILFLSVPLILYLNRLVSVTHNTNDHGHKLTKEPLGGRIYAGFSEILSNKKLAGIGLFIFIYTGISAFVYFAQKTVLVDFDREVRAQIWAGLDLAVNIMTFVFGLFLTSKIVERFGLKFSLSIIPFLVMLGLLLVVGFPSVLMIVGLQFVRKVGNYAITKPSREMLFTGISTEARFKAKPVVDIVIYRGGDLFWGWSFAILTDQLGLGLGKVAIIGAVIALVWGLTGVYLGNQHENDRTKDINSTASKPNTNTH